ncbi:MAG: hypothetical protein FWH29_00105 [Methanobrevibacter sp.]|nr:hypothetical protein [Methanobrevibacter sp.]
MFLPASKHVNWLNIMAIDLIMIIQFTDRIKMTNLFIMGFIAFGTIKKKIKVKLSSIIN